MTHAFDKAYWEQRYAAGGSGASSAPLPNPYLVRESEHLSPGTALDAGCGHGAEAMYLEARGWRVTAVDIAGQAINEARRRSAAAGLDVRWLEADLTSWSPDERFDLVTTHYAHPAMPQLDFYRRIAGWVAPGGSLLIVAHAPHPEHGEHAEHHRPGTPASLGEQGGPPPHAMVRLLDLLDLLSALDPDHWNIVSAEETSHTVPHGHGETVLHDAVVRASRRE